jgi:hypothetical protein
MPPDKSHRLVILTILPLFSCLLSSFIGIVLGQAGNLIYKLAGEAGAWLALPSFCGLFLFTAGFSFFLTRTLRKLANR